MTIPPCAPECWFVQALLADRAHLLADRARLTGTTLATQETTWGMAHLTYDPGEVDRVRGD